MPLLAEVQEDTVPEGLQCPSCGRSVAWWEDKRDVIDRPGYLARVRTCACGTEFSTIEFVAGDTEPCHCNAANELAEARRELDELREKLRDFARSLK